MIAGFGFSIFIFIFYRDNPEDCQLLPDGERQKGKKSGKIIAKALRQFSLKEARRTYSYWVFTISLAVHAMMITGFIFNVVSIFSEAGMDKTTALSIFIPVSFVSVIVTLAGGYFSDFIKLKKLLIIMLLGQILSAVSLSLLSIHLFYYLLILGNGIISGMYAVLISVLWPRFYGREHLGKSVVRPFLLSCFSALWGPCCSAFPCRILARTRWLHIFVWLFFWFACLPLSKPTTSRRSWHKQIHIINTLTDCWILDYP